MLDLLDAQVLELVGDFFRDFLIWLDDDLAGVRMDDLLQGDPADDAVDERLDNFSVLDDGGDVDSLERPAILFIDDGFLSHIYELAGQVAGIGRFQGRIRQPFPAPWVEMKYCITFSPSRRLEVIGVSMISPEGLLIRPRIPASCRICCLLPREPESAMTNSGLSSLPSKLTSSSPRSWQWRLCQ